jgi:hypothetical protein
LRGWAAELLAGDYQLDVAADDTAIRASWGDRLDGDSSKMRQPTSERTDEDPSIPSPM